MRLALVIPLAVGIGLSIGFAILGSLYDWPQNAHSGAVLTAIGAGVALRMTMHDHHAGSR